MKKRLEILLSFLCLCYSVLAYSQNKNIALVPFQSNKLYGLSDTLGKIILKPQFLEIKNFGYYFDKKANKLSDSRFVVKNTGKYFLIDYKNQKLIAPDNPYDSIVLDKEDCRIAYIYSKGKAGVFLKNKAIITTSYDKIQKKENLSFEVLLSGKKAIVNSEGTVIIPLDNYKYLSYNGSDNGKVHWTAKNSEEKRINFSDTLVEFIPDNESPIYYSNDNYKFPFEKDIPNLEDKKKLVGKQYKRIEYSFMKRYIEIEKEGLHTFYDFYLDKELFPLQYQKFDLVGADHNTILFIAKKGDRYGLLNLDGKIVLPEQYEEIKQNKDGVLLKKNSKYGLYIPNTIYKYIETKFNEPVKKHTSIPISKSWTFSVYKADGNYIGENGIEYFK